MDRRSFLAPGSSRGVKAVSTPTRRANNSGIEPYQGPWTRAEVAHLLKRTMFGARRQDVEYFLGRGMTRSVDELLTPTAPLPAPPLKNYANTNTPTTDPDLAVAPGATWVDTHTLDGTVQGGRRASFRSWWMGRMLNQDRSIREKMTLFWHNHFATQANNLDARYVYRHHRMLREKSLGNIKDLVRSVTVDPAMLVFLNGYLNIKTAPDENYARELQELFTLGKENDPNFTEADVKAAARVLTGWRVDASRNISFFDLTRHDTGDKAFSSFFGNRVIKGRLTTTAGDQELDELLDMIFAKAEQVSRHIVTKLYRWFVYYEVTDSVKSNVIEPLALILRNSNWEVRPVLSALFRSRHFYDTLSQGCMIKSPVDQVVGLCREFEVAFPPTDYAAQYVHWNYVRNWAAQVQQNIGDPPDISGWKAYYQTPNYYGIWINSDTYPRRNQFQDTMVLTGYTANTHKIMIDPVAYAKTFANPGDPNALISDITGHLLRLPLSQTLRNQLKKDILLSGQDQDYYWTNAWTAHVGSPSDMAALRTVQKRLQDLVKYIMNLPEYQLA